MPELYDIDSERVLMPGDVVMCDRKMRDKQTRKLYQWKFFMVVTEPTHLFGDRVTGFVLGTSNERLREEPLNLSVNDEKNAIHYLPPDEWPPGVHAFRMALILKRKIEID